MGEVYLASDSKLKRDVAIKVMDARIEDYPELIARFEREADTVARLRHPNIVRLYDKDRYEVENRTHYYIVMEYVEGEDLATLINSKVFVPFEQKLEIVIKICRALDHAHRKGVIHRDIKPSNVRITCDGDVCVLDFGLAKFKDAQPVGSMGVFGTPHYMSPEQTLSSSAVDKRSDLFSTALILYELITYRKPFSTEDPGDVLAYMSAIRTDEPLPISHLLPRCSPELVKIINRALEKRPDDRFESCGDFADALTAFLKTLPQKEDDLLRVVDELRVAVKRLWDQCGDGRPESCGTDPLENTEPEFPASSSIQFLSRDVRLDYGVNLFRCVRLEQRKQNLQKIAEQSPSNTGASWHNLQFALRKPTNRRFLMIGFAGLMLAPFLVHFLSPPPEPGTVELTVAPWGRVESIVDTKTGASVSDRNTTLPCDTPCRIELPRGTYKLSINNPKFGSMEIQVDVVAGQGTRIHRTFPGFNP
jgi:serine/threonine protein kinase